VQHRGGSGGSMVANHRGGGEISMVVTTLELTMKLALLWFQNVSCQSVSVGFAEKNRGFRFGLGFHDRRVVNFFMTRVIRHDFHDC